MVKLARVGVVIPARNENKNISQTLVHLVNQTLAPTQVIVVNDGSLDNTKELAEWFYPVVDFPIRHDNWVAHKYLAQVFNFGFSQLDYSKLDYLMILGSDHLLPCDYIEKVTNRMKAKSTVIASGSIKGEPARLPRGSGRLIDIEFWQSLGCHYPINWGFETFILEKAHQQNKGIEYYSDIETTVTRKTSSTFNPTHYFYYGKALKALGFTNLRVLAKAVFLAKRNPRISLALIRGFKSLDSTDCYDKTFRAFVKKDQTTFNAQTIKLVTQRILG